MGLVGIANGNKGSDKDTDHVALALSAVAHQSNQQNYIRKSMPYKKAIDLSIVCPVDRLSLFYLK